MVGQPRRPVVACYNRPAARVSGFVDDLVAETPHKPCSGEGDSDTQCPVRLPHKLHTLLPVTLACLFCPFAKAAAPAVSLVPSSLSFAATPVGSSAATQSVTLKNTGAAPLSLSGAGQGISVYGPNALSFAQTNTCGASLAAGAHCTITVTFKPMGPGTRVASVLVTGLRLATKSRADWRRRRPCRYPRARRAQLRRIPG
ncbi:MAG: choice-of-anchor D domain-containing protein [Terracidiphilus sp.]